VKKVRIAAWEMEIYGSSPLYMENWHSGKKCQLFINKPTNFSDLPESGNPHKNGLSHTTKKLH